MAEEEECIVLGAIRGSHLVLWRGRGLGYGVGGWVGAGLSDLELFGFKVKLDNTR